MLFQPKANLDLAEMHLALSFSARVPEPQGRTEIFPPAQSIKKFDENLWSRFLLTIFTRNE